MDPMSVALSVADEASEIMNQWFEKGITVEAKADHSPVTQADLEINTMARDRIKAAFPDHGFIGEELSAPSSSDDVWICDPLDGTRPFSLGIPISTFTLALMRNGKPVLGVIAWPFRNQRFAAEAGSGATLNGQLFKSSDTPAIAAEKLVEIASFQRLALYVPGIVDEMGERGYVTLWSNTTALSTCLVATGQLSGMIWTSDTPWDIAAGKIIADEAGAVLTDLYGNDQRYDQSINGAVVGRDAETHAELLEAVNKCGIVPGHHARWELPK